MKLSSQLQSRHWLLILLVALCLALAATYAPVVLDNALGTAFTPTSYACGPASGGC